MGSVTAVAATVATAAAIATAATVAWARAVGATEATVTTTTAITTTTTVATAAALTTAAITTAAFTATTVAAATAATTSTTKAATATKATAAWRTWLHGACFIDHNATTTQRLAIHALDGGLCFGIAAHFNKAKALGAACVALHHDLGAGHGTELAKSLFQIAVAHRVWQVADVQFVAHRRTPQKHMNKAMESRKRSQLISMTLSARN